MKVHTYPLFVHGKIDDEGAMDGPRRGVDSCYRGKGARGVSTKNKNTKRNTRVFL
jgi:hypothetical protein